MSQHTVDAVSQGEEIRSHTRLQDLVVGMLPLLVGAQIVFWFVFLPIGFRGDADFSIFYTAGRMVRTGYRQQLYNYDQQLQVEREFVSKTPAPYNHLPYEALVFAPLSYFPYRTAYIIFLFCNLGLAAIGFLLIRERIGSRWLAAAIFAAYFPVAATIADGQDSIMLLVVAGFAWWFYSRNQEWLSGVVLALGLFRFTIVLPIVGLIFLWRRWRFAAGFAITSTVLLICSTWMVGIGQMRLYVAHLLSLSGMAQQEAGYYSLSYALPRMMNLRGFFVNVLGSERIGGGVAILAAIALLLWMAIKARHVQPHHQFALAVAFSVLVSYHLFIYDLTILLIPMMAALGPAEFRNSTLGKTAVVLPWIAVPIGLLWHPFLVALPLSAFLWILIRLFEKWPALGQDYRTA